jgi:tetratricopeptide (TPR) repeat protein
MGERRIITYGLDYFGHLALWQGHYQQAYHYYWQVYQTRRELRDQISLGFSYESLGEWAYHVGHYDDAETYLKQGLAIHRDVGNRLHALTPNRLGTLARLRRDLVQATTYHQQALAFARQENVIVIIGESLEGLGCVAYERQDYAQATQYLQQSLEIWQEQQAKGRLASILCYLGHAAAGNEQRSAAVSYYRQALSITLETGMVPVTLDILRGVAELLIRDKAHEQAIELLALAQHHSASTYETKAKAQVRLTELAAHLPNDLVAAATKRGQALDLLTVAAKWVAASFLSPPQFPLWA